MILSVLNGIIYKLLRVSLRHDPFLHLLNCTLCEKVTFKLSYIYATTIADAKGLSYNDVRDLEGYLSYISFHFKNTIFKIIFKTYESKQIFTSFSSSRAKK